MKQIDLLMAAARADADQQNAWLKHEHPAEASDDDEGVLMLRAWAKFFDEADLRDETVRVGLGIACKWLINLGEDYACCQAHGEHLIATARMLMSTVAREELHP